MGADPGPRAARARYHKKAVAGELTAQFPARFSGADSQALLHYQQHQRRLLALCDFLTTGEGQHLGTVAEVDAWLLEQSLPDVFDDGHPDNVLVAHRRRFGELCAALAEQGYPQPHLLTVADFNSAVSHLLKRNSREKGE